MRHNAPTPQIQRSGGGDAQQANEGHQAQVEHAQTALCRICLRTGADDRATDAQPQRQSRRARQGQAQHADGHCGGTLNAVAGPSCQAEKQQSPKAQLTERGRGFVCKPGQAQASQQRQQTPIGHGAGVVRWFGLAAKRKGHRLCCGVARQCIHRVPSGGQCGDQHADKWQSGKEVFEACGCQSNEGGTQPIGQQGQVAVGAAQQRGFEPADGFACCRLRQLQHVAEGFNVLRFPKRSAPKARQHIGRAQQKQGHTRQPAHGTLCHDGGGREVHRI